MFRLRFIALFVTGCAASSADPNALILEITRSYPTDGSYGYDWPKTGGWDGTTEAVTVDGIPLTQGDPRKRSYCCGLTYEVFLKAHRALGPAAPPDRLKELKLRWYGNSKLAPERRMLVAFALESMGFGARPASLDEARPGVFVQFWRGNGSGHSAIFLGWVREEGRIAGITYWSSQKSTNGIGVATERVGGPDGVRPEEIFLARLTSGTGR